MQLNLAHRNFPVHARLNKHKAKHSLERLIVELASSSLIFSDYKVASCLFHCFSP